MLRSFFALVSKDLENAKWAFTPALMLGVPLLLLVEFTQSSSPNERVSWLSAFWISFFIATTSLYFRSFGLEHRFKNFHLYSAIKTSRLQIFMSQTLVHFVSAFLLGLCYLFLCLVFFSPGSIDWMMYLKLIALVSICLSPLGTLLGLMLQLEREFLFSIIYLPLATPVILAAHNLCMPDASPNWLSVLSIFALAGGFVSAMIFEFFFDELSQSL